MSDQLLEWMSFRKEGRVDAIPAERMPASPYRVLSNLSALGHIEAAADSSWRVAPPMLACLPQRPDNGAAAVLCGARTAGLLQRLNSAGQSRGASILIRQASPWPSVIQVLASSHAVLAEVAAEARMTIQNDAAYTMLACVPSIRNWPRQPCPMVGGRVETVRRFSGSGAKWVPSSLAEAQAATKGFFRIKRDWDWVSIFKLSKTDSAYIDDRAGRLLAASKRPHAAWNAASCTFSVPAHLFPPTLIARALVLCSGLLPDYDRVNGRISFGGVTPAMLRLTLAITGLRLA